jgi:hypothetical protein
MQVGSDNHVECCKRFWEDSSCHLEKMHGFCLSTVSVACTCKSTSSLYSKEAGMKAGKSRDEGYRQRYKDKGQRWGQG